MVVVLVDDVLVEVGVLVDVVVLELELEDTVGSVSVGAGTPFSEAVDEAGDAPPSDHPIAADTRMAAVAARAARRTPNPNNVYANPSRIAIAAASERSCTWSFCITWRTWVLAVS